MGFEKVENLQINIAKGIVLSRSRLNESQINVKKVL